MLGTLAWTVVAHSIHRQAAAEAASRARHPAVSGTGQMQAAIYRHPLATGFSRGFEVAAGIPLLALVVAVPAIRVRRADIAGGYAPTSR